MSNKDDCISRQAAIDAYGDWYVEEGTEEGFIGTVKQLLEGLPSAQPATNCSEIPNGSDDTISRQAAIEALARMMPRSYTPDGSHPADEEIFRAQEVFADCIEALEILPSVQQEQRWIPSGERPPEEGSYLVWMPFAPPEERIAVEYYCDGYWNIKTPISAWMPLPAPYEVK